MNRGVIAILLCLIAVPAVSVGNPSLKEFATDSAERELTPNAAKFEIELLRFYGPAVISRQQYACGLISGAAFAAAAREQGYQRILLMGRYRLSEDDLEAMEKWEWRFVKKVETDLTCDVLRAGPDAN